MAANSDEILCDFSPMLKAYKDGRIDRLTNQETVPPSVDPTTGVQSKDVEIAPEFNISARIFLPGNANPSQKLPLLVYFHGGGLVVQTAFSPLYHKHLNFLVAEANVVAVSVDYRLAPENPIPIPFDDSWLAIQWVASQFTEEGHEGWIKDYADPNRVYFGGDSAGATITHNMAIRVGPEKLGSLKLRGFFLNCPYFWGANPIGDEADHPMKGLIDQLLVLACPGLSMDEPWINPANDEKIWSLGGEKVLVYVAGKEVTKWRGLNYKEILKNGGWDGEVECVEVAGEDHIFSVFSPDGPNGSAMLKKVASFINH
ncbi:hypothetical protein ACS0TY_005366 [Phlomoides rotata]